MFFSLVWASISLGIAAFVKANGRVFCNRPRLHKPRSWLPYPDHCLQLTILNCRNLCTSMSLPHFLWYLFYYYTNFVVIIASKIISYPTTVVDAFSPVLALASSLYMHVLFVSCIRLKHLKLLEIHIQFILFVCFQENLFFSNCFVSLLYLLQTLC